MIEELNKPELNGSEKTTTKDAPKNREQEASQQEDCKEDNSCWADDMTLGWVYQYWNDPERERLDAKINDGGKIEPHEIASKTQMFTERYMVDWMLQNSLGLMWFTLCKKNGWAPEVQTNGTLQRLEERRIDWRAKRAAGEVSLTELMPLESEEERRWAYFLPGQEIPDEAVELAPASVREWKILHRTDPQSRHHVKSVRTAESPDLLAIRSWLALNGKAQPSKLSLGILGMGALPAATNKALAQPCAMSLGDQLAVGALLK